MAQERETSFDKQLNTECKFNILNFKDKKDPNINHATINQSKFRDIKSLISGSPYNIINQSPWPGQEKICKNLDTPKVKNDEHRNFNILSNQ